MTDDDGPAIEATGLAKSYGPVRVLAGVDLRVGRGSVFSLLGPNGAGKTTTVRILSTLMRPDAGHARVAGLDVVRDRHRVRRTISVTGQYAALDELQTGAENLRMMGRLSGLPGPAARKRAGQMLERFGLADAGRRRVATYSGGMRRRLDLAAALVANPPVLFLDEPTTGLDPQSRQGLWAAIEELVRGGTTVLLTTQYLEEADRLARDIVVIDHGRVIAEGTPAQLKADLGTSVVSITLATREAVDQAVRLVAPFSDKPPVVEDLVVELTVTDGPRAGADVLRTLDAAQIPLTGLALREPSLDDVFLNLTGHKTTINEDGEKPSGQKRGFGRNRKNEVDNGKDAA
jgi:ABC-2 type transport system ATP-binding protein